MKPLVCFVDAKEPTLWTEIEVERVLLANCADVSLIRLAENEPICPTIREAHALIVSHYPQLSRDLLRSLRKARVIVRNGVGFDNVDVAAASELGMPVCNVPDYGTEEVADHALLLTLALARRLPSAVRNVQSGGFEWQSVVPGRRIRGQLFGIVGCGRIGTAVALRAKTFGYDVQFFDPYLPSGYEKALAIRRCSTLEELLESSDVVSLHALLNSETGGILNEARFALMKPGALLVNTARGALVKESALLASLKSGRLAGAALDVVEREPHFDSELLTHSNCIITPHCAFYSDEAQRELRTTAAQIVLTVLQGGLPFNVVNGVGSCSPSPSH